jgi:serine protease Do
MRYNGNISMGSTYSGLCFAIPINSARKVVDEIIETGSYSGNGDVAEKAVNLGVTGGTVVEGQSITISGQTFTPATNGVIISSVKEGYPAEGKLEVFDIITHIGGVATTTFEELKLEIKSYKVGDTVEFTVFRNNSSIVVSITF